MTADLLSPFNLTGRIALVTGGSGGIGRACVERLAAYGATVALTFVEGVEDAARVLAGFGDLPVTAHPLDLRDADSIRRCIAGVAAQHGRIDILVNNAAVGTATVAAFSDDPGTQDSLMLAINADGTLKMCQEFLALPGGPGRKLINISSVGGGITAFPGFRLSDGMSKAAVAFLTRQLAAEAVHDEVDVFAICPGATNTPMFQASTLSKLSTETLSGFLAGLPKGRLIEPAEIAALVHFLSGPSSRVLHGAVLDASMGLGVRPGLLSEQA
ncbi:SDR family oxidoreductase [Rhodobacteraceae bacterium KMS-5]|uniref:SDR family oxidoreductase n=1 Tax=Tabrizicola oligotrophica TaxID=2710650 RepID=A0A6M0QYT2_9RHOB|nr:SDR family oxidoreductase [Tabrizicola oligotrophica]NEY92033.1 SDR family oxidoreductase [Tabrizicola oligotrophica]